MSDEDLMKRLREDVSFNPWLVASRKWRNSSCGSYCLEGDADRIKCYHTVLSGDAKKDGRSKKELEFRLELLPQPFVGTPESGIWLMLKNPGYSKWDEYDDHGGSIENKGELREWTSGEEEKQMLLKRRELTFKQYEFVLQGTERFYVLNDAFRTKKDAVGKCEGAYRWYQRQLFPDRGLIKMMSPDIEPSQYSDWCSRNLFVLDYLPYHSAKFYNSGVDCLKQKYWSALVKHGLINNKLLVFWGSKILNRVKKDYPNEFESAAKEGRIAILRGQKAVFSDWNFVFATDKCGTKIKEFVK